MNGRMRDGRRIYIYIVSWSRLFFFLIAIVVLRTVISFDFSFAVFSSVCVFLTPVELSLLLILDYPPPPPFPLPLPFTASTYFPAGHPFSRSRTIPSISGRYGIPLVLCNRTLCLLVCIRGCSDAALLFRK